MCPVSHCVVFRLNLRLVYEYSCASRLPVFATGCVVVLRTPASAAKPELTLSYEAPHWLVIHGDHIPGKQVRINYLEAYCRANSTDADWVKHTVVKHEAQLISLNEEKTVLRVRDRVSDGLIVEHTIKAGREEIEIVISEKNHESHFRGALGSAVHTPGRLHRVS